MTIEEAQIIIGNIPIKPEVLDDCYDITEYQEAKAMAIEALAEKSYSMFFVSDYRCPNCGARMKVEE